MRLYPQSRWFPWIVVFTTVALRNVLAASAESNAASRDTFDQFCGPRCVWQMLKQFGIDENLDAVIGKMNMQSSSRGASVQEIEKVLRQYGLYAHAGKLEHWGKIDWPYPVIVHTQEGGGHFLLLYPQSDDATEEIWDGAKMTFDSNSFRVRKQPSGLVIFASRTDFAQETITAIRSDSANSLTKALVTMPLIFAALAFFSWRLLNSRGTQAKRKEEHRIP